MKASFTFALPFLFYFDRLINHNEKPSYETTNALFRPIKCVENCPRLWREIDSIFGAGLKNINKNGETGYTFDLALPLSNLHQIKQYKQLNQYGMK